MMSLNPLENRLFSYFAQHLKADIRGRFRYSQLLAELKLSLNDLVDALEELQDKNVINVATFPSKDWFVVELNE